MPTVRAIPSLQLRLVLVSLQLQYVNEKLVRDPRLREIIEYCVPRKLLGSIWFWAWRGLEVHARLVVTLSEDNTTSAITIETSGRAGEAAKKVMEGVPLGPEEQVTCPVWAQAISLFSELCDANGLALSWRPVWRDRAEELDDRFGIHVSSAGAITIIDKTEGKEEQRVHNTMFSELEMATAFSDEVSLEVTKPQE